MPNTRNHRIVLSPSAYDQLLSFLEEDAEPSPQLVESMREYRRAIDTGELVVTDQGPSRTAQRPTARHPARKPRSGGH